MKNTNNSIKTQYINKEGIIWDFEYFDCDDFSVLDKSKCSQCRAVCYILNENGEGVVCIVKNGKKNTWGLVGGSIEAGESFEDTLRRELKEEGNLELIYFKPIGYQTAKNEARGEDLIQLRFFAIARKYGEFISDPGGSISEVKFINPKDYKNYQPWTDVGDYVFDKAAKIFEKYKNNNL
jgi:ADP-ribose pyrophosphatase YjhB (NUDIX family)